MITDDRLKKLMQDVGMPDSLSLMQALRQCDMEARIEEKEKSFKECGALKTLVNHWNEFGPECGFDEIVHNASKILEDKA